MFETREFKKQTKGFAPLSQKQTSPGRADSTRESGNSLGTTHFLQRHLGNSYMQSLRSVPTIQRKCDCGGTCASCASKEDASRKLQTKLTIGPADDVYEQEADRVAEQVMRMPDSSVHTENEQPGVGMNIQRISASGPDSLTSAPDIHLNPSGGRLLSPSTRQFMEPRFGVDFGHVRLHTDGAAHQTASDIQARAFTYGHHVWLGKGESEQNKHLMAHELTHVVQQSPNISINESAVQSDQKSSGNRYLNHWISYSTPVLHRRVIDSHVSCRHTGLHGGVPGGVISGADAIAVIRAADDRAIELARRAENLLFLQRLTFGTGAYTADPAFDAALTNRFGLNLANPGDHRTIEILEREFKAVADFLASGSPLYTCRSGLCGPDVWAFSLVPGRRIFFCNPFWNAPSLNLQGSTLLHEAFHLWWDQIDDQGRPPLHNAHCFEQFALDLAGATAEIPPEFAGACVVPGP